MVVLETMSKKFDLSQEDLKRSFHWSLVFLAPLALIYLTSVITILSFPGHIFSLQDLFPNPVTAGALALYILDRLYDIVMRFIADNKESVIERSSSIPPEGLG